MPVKTFANTTVSSPQSQSTGVVNNNATMITPSSLPQNRYSQGIVCTSPSLTITPYLTDAWSFNRPIETVTRQAIYDEDTGEIKYYQETPRFEKDNYNLNYGISMQFNIPLGKSPTLCHEATEVNIEAETGYINPTATTQSTQTVGGVNFSWTSPNLEAVPRWKIATDGAAFSIQETLITPGLDTVTNITRTITTSTTSETTSTFGQ